MNKRIIKSVLLPLLALPLLAGCGNKGYKETRSEEEVVKQLAANVVAEIGVSYSKFSAEGVNLGDNELVVNVNQKVWEEDQVGLNFKVAYTVTPQEQYPRAYLSINEAGDTLTSVVVTEDEIASFPMAASLGGAAYFLKASISFVGYGEGFVAPNGLSVTETFVGQEVATKQWNALVKTIKSGTISEVKASAKATDMVVIRGIVSAAYNWIYEEIFRGVVISDGDDGILLYAGCLQASFYDSATGPMKIKQGDVIEVYGEVSPYNGLFEVKPRTIRVITEQALIDAIKPAAFREPTIDEFKAFTQKDTGALVKLSGLLLNMTSIALSKLKVGEHWVIELKNSEGKKLNMSVNYHVGAENQEGIRTFLKGLSGAEFTMEGMVSATSNVIDISAVAIAEQTVLEGFSK